MESFYTVVLLLATVFGIYMGVRKKASLWKHGALVLGSGFMLSGLWLTEAWSTIPLVGGGILFFLGALRDPEIRRTSPSIDLAPSRVVLESGSGGIHVLFPSPRFYAVDTQVMLLLDGRTIYEGGFKEGIDVTVPVAPGQHRLESVMAAGIAKRRRTWDIAVAPSGCNVILEYSRFWGNFAKGVRIGSLAAADGHRER